MEKDKVISGCKAVVIGGSAGSLKVLMYVLPLLQTIPTFAIIIILHRKNTEDNSLEELIAVKTIVPVKIVEDKTAITPGFIYVAPSDYHLLFEKNKMLSLDISEKVNHSRPSIDVSFESAAEVFQSSLVGLLLSGSNSDGMLGLKAIQKLGGKVAVQDPDSADMPFMPNSAINNLDPDYVIDEEGIALLLSSINLQD
ncbi:chemotaxis protein CheB [Flavobacterium sp. 7A]|uniref:chemotaxis protein CheB n=1 Tax=Flavobacterium sp. 7A TaxID=2940571 RepID=UPI002226B800|nr:chemotaxis protein CheB [Flavobacterium sp. 7A]MCW2119120.1 two-component system chemotaxis response regulator CheB [Flavobacterium sp. 7A]